MYDSVTDPYCYSGTSILKNRAHIRDQATLDAFEDDAATQRAEEAFPSGLFSVSHYKAIHHHLFQDVYTWAGKFRKIRIAKNSSMFCYPEHISIEMRRLFDRLRSENFYRNISSDVFAQKIEHFLSELNAIHPFREGNGRTQLVWLTILAEHAGQPVNLETMNPSAILDAMIASFNGNEGALERLIHELIAKR